MKDKIAFWVSQRHNIPYRFRKSFKSQKDFESVFPQDYNYFKFFDVTEEKSSYKIAAFDYNAIADNMEIIAVPVEKRIFLNNKVKQNKPVAE
jgi:hypothetical protein